MLGEYLTGFSWPANADNEQRGLFWQDEAGSSHIMTLWTPNSLELDALDWCPLSDPSMNLPCTDTNPLDEVAAARSRHAGGVNVVMADGSVHFITNGISLAAWQAIGSIDGGETLLSSFY